MCVAPETKILTDQGHQVIKSLMDQEVNVWNGLEFSKTTVRQTGINQKLIKVVLSNGTEIECTPYHKFYIQTGYGDVKDLTDKKIVQIVEAKDLKEDMKLVKCELPDIEMGETKGVIKVVKVVDEGRKDDTFCFTEPKRNAGIFNGVMTSNCSEIVEVSNSKDYSNCNLASIALPSYITNNEFDFEKFGNVIDVIVENLNLIIDKNTYPTPETKTTNLSHRPIGIGIQGLADVFAKLKYAFDSKEAKELNEKISEYMYYYALRSSCEQSKLHGPYEFFKGSPASQGQLQFDLWDYTPRFISLDKWNDLREEIKTHGLRNSLLIALMPTASTANILGCNSCFEPFVNNIFTRRILAGEFTILNKHLMNELVDQGLWDKDMKQEILYNNGSIQSIGRVPDNLKNLYKTAFEIKQKVIIDMARDRGRFVCQSQSMNLFIEKPSYNLLTNMHFYGWKQGLKTGSYYIRTKPAVNSQKFTLDVSKELEFSKKKNLKPNVECVDDVCVMCSS